jgi:2-dehydro-3-deoxygluconokinase
VGDSLTPSVPGGHPGLYLIELDASGERAFSYWRGQSAARRWVEVADWPRLAGADLIFFTGISLAILPPAMRGPALERLRAARPRRIAFDPNVRVGLWESQEAMLATCKAALAMSDIALPSREDTEAIAGQADAMELASRLLSLGPSEIALTLGAEGCLVAQEGSVNSVAAPPARVADTSGAGDAFNGAYLAARLRGEDASAAAAAGLARAARVVARRGALPELDEEGP